jgi:sigma-B regulation protein RsbU (phosphoserine phosphatase)
MDATQSKLKAIIDASRQLTEVLELDRLVPRILSLACLHAKAERATLYLLEGDHLSSSYLAGESIERFSLPLGQGIAGHVAQTGEALILEDAYRHPLFHPEIDRQTGFQTRSMMCLPVAKDQEILGVLQIIDPKVGAFGEADVDFMKALVAHIAIALANARHHHERILKEKAEKELEVAAAIQRRMLPRSMATPPALEVSWKYLPFHGVGGDFFDYFAVDEHRHVFVVADVSGKGIPAALIVGALGAFLRCLRHYYRGPAQLAAELNGLLYEAIPANAFASMIIVEYDLKNRRLTYCNGGHCTGFLAFRSYVHRLANTGILLGLFPAATFCEQWLDLDDACTLWLYTDGLVEGRRMLDQADQWEEWGEERLEQWVGSSFGQELEALHQAWMDFTRDHHQMDDTTVLRVHHYPQK